MRRECATPPDGDVGWIVMVPRLQALPPETAPATKQAVIARTAWVAHKTSMFCRLHFSEVRCVLVPPTVFEVHRTRTGRTVLRPAKVQPVANEKPTSGSEQKESK